LLLRSLAELEFYNGALIEGWKLAQQAYLLEPDNPVDAAVLAKFWVTLGRMDEAERLLQHGLERTGQNVNLLNVRWLSLVVAGRLEEAEQMVHDAMAESEGNLPDALRRVFSLRLGMLALVRGDFAVARSYLDAAAGAEAETVLDSDVILALTLGALAAQRANDPGAASDRLDAAERKLRRARVNGVEDAGILYSEAAILALRNQPQPALEKLRLAYERGFRELWLFKLDWRLDPLRGDAGFAALRARIEEDIEQCLAAIRSTELTQL
jgi:tetratricopeptide (TPR) repeat protein